MESKVSSCDVISIRRDQIWMTLKGKRKITQESGIQSMWFFSKYMAMLCYISYLMFSFFNLNLEFLIICLEAFPASSRGIKTLDHLWYFGNGKDWLLWLSENIINSWQFLRKPDFVLLPGVIFPSLWMLAETSWNPASSSLQVIPVNNEARVRLYAVGNNCY